jgi:hypothetical protein
LLSKKEYVCIPCGKGLAAHGHATRLTNGYDHARNQHPEELPFNCWTENKSLMEKLPLPRRCVVARHRFETFISKQSIDCQNKSDGVECLYSLCAWIYDDESDEVVEESSEY